MESNNKKSVKQTNSNQFQKLVELMEKYPQLATGSPSSRLVVEETWDNVANQVNAFGPPVRSGLEWKRVWHDQKCRLKKKIMENYKSLHGIGGCPGTINSLNELEQHIDRICHLSSAAATSGSVLGLPCAHKLAEKTHPRRPLKVAVVTPTSSQHMNDNNIAQLEDSSDLLGDLSPIPKAELLHQQKTKVTSTPEGKSPPHNRKRRNLELRLDRLKLLRYQSEIHNKTLDIMQKHAEAAKIQAEAAKIQAEVAQDQAKALKEVSESAKLIGHALIGIMKHLKDKD